MKQQNENIIYTFKAPLAFYNGDEYVKHPSENPELGLVKMKKSFELNDNPMVKNIYYSHDQNDRLIVGITVESNKFLSIKEVQKIYSVILKDFAKEETSPTTGQSIIHPVIQDIYDIDCEVSQEQETEYQYALTSDVSARIYPDENIHKFAPPSGVMLNDFDILDLNDAVSNIEDAIHESFNSTEKIFGLAPYFDFEGSEKIISAKPMLVENDYQLKMETIVQTTEPLTDEEMTNLKGQLSGQFYDGWGESFEQQDIHIPDGVLNFYSHTNYNLEILHKLISEPEESLEQGFELSY